MLKYIKRYFLKLILILFFRILYLNMLFKDMFNKDCFVNCFKIFQSNFFRSNQVYITTEKIMIFHCHTVPAFENFSALAEIA